jgi:ABC-type Fe3+ transport system permease subunit
MDGVPIELEEAAWTDGASPMRGLLRIVMPLMGPGLSVVAIYTFIGLWGNFFVPFILLLTPEKQPMSVTIYTFFGQYGQVVYGQLAVLLAALGAAVPGAEPKPARRVRFRGQRQGLRAGRMLAAGHVRRPMPRTVGLPPLSAATTAAIRAQRGGRDHP